MSYVIRISSLLVFSLMIGSVGCDKLTRSTESSFTPVFKPEDPKVVAERKRIMEIRTKIEKNVSDGIKMYFDKGPHRLEDEFHFSNGSKYDLREINLTVTYKLGSGKELSSQHFWGTWDVNSKRVLKWAAEDYQQVRIKGKAKLAKSVDDVRDIEFDLHWNL